MRPELRARRIQLGLNLTQCAGETGIEISRLSRIERGEVRKVDVRDANAIARVYGIPQEAWGDPGRAAKRLPAKRALPT